MTEMQLTKRNHYTPCFWAALWSETYYRSFLAGVQEAESVRDQPVHALNVKSGRLFETTVENVHFDKNLCVAEITRESAEDFAKRHHPDKFEEFLRTNATANYPVFLDFENVLTGLEHSAAYQTLMAVAKAQRIQIRNGSRFSCVFRCPATPALPRNHEFDDPVARGVRPSQV
jgi:hypothetical protein